VREGGGGSLGAYCNFVHIYLFQSMHLHSLGDEINILRNQMMREVYKGHPPGTVHGT
jgi:hypothetical protein